MYIIQSASFMGTDCTCRDKKLNVSGGSMQSGEAGDLFEKTIIPFPSFMSPHTNASFLHLQRRQYQHHPCIVDIQQALFSPSSHPLTLSTRYILGCI